MRIRVRRLLLVPLLGAAVPAGAQEAPPAPARPPFPGIAWGVGADSVIRVWGEPTARSATRDGLDELDYHDVQGGRALARYIMVHPSLGTILAGYTAPFRTEAECVANARAALDEIGRDYPELRWTGGRAPDAAALCDGTLGPGGADGRDPASGTRIGIRVNRGGTGLVADAISREGFRWVGTAR